MSRQAEATLEKQLIDQLKSLDYEFVVIPNEKALLSNLKTQVEAFNNIRLSDKEFAGVINHLSKGNVFAKAKTLRDRFQFTRDDGERVYIGFFNSEDWTGNLFQVTNQVTIDGVYKNRYDVTILINGIPLVQIELKRRGLELKEAFNQINRYHRHSFWANTALFQYIQVFVISNGVNTKYYANNKKQSFKQTFFWADGRNRNISELRQFAGSFLKQDFLGKMIARYVVLNETYKILMVLRPYQVYAVEAIIDHVKKEGGNGYIWHTTGSGKTLTSFKTSQIIMDMPGVHKVVFVVDRKDLDYQTIKEFNSFRKGSVDGTDKTTVLIDQFLDRYVDKSGEAKNTKLIVTTIQKLNNAIHKQKYLAQMEGLKTKRIIFIFDECHRSQFGETHKRITAFFNNFQMFGFTGTPIFADNAHKNDLGKRTTKDLFEKRLHEYTLINAVKDENVLKFKIEYIGRYKQSGNTIIDIDVEDIDTKEVLNSPDRLGKIVDYIIQYHDQKTQAKAYSSIFAVGSIDNLITYYQLFRDRIQAEKIDLRVAGVFTYGANEESRDANGHIADTYGVEDQSQAYLKVAEPQAPYNGKIRGQAGPKGNTNSSHTREKLDAMIADYNRLYGTSFSTKENQSFANYATDISKRLKEREKDSFREKDRLDILLVVNMFLTGFDAKKLNTLYVDKNLKHHGLIQAFSRTNRIINETKSQGNILCFRNLKKAADDAIALFSNKDAKEKILLPDYEVVAQQFTKAFTALLQIAPTVNSVDDLISEDDQVKFVQAFRELMRLKNILTSYSDYNWDDLPMNEQNFEDYKSKYLDIYDRVRSDHKAEKVSILNDVDFELELIHRDEINVAYILKLIAKLQGAAAPKDQKLQTKAVLDLMAGDITLRSKRELIKKFIKENLPKIDADSIQEEFEKFWQEEKILALGKICEDEQLDREQFKALIEAYVFSGQEPLREDVIKCLAERPSILQARRIGEKIIDKMKAYVQTFIRGMVA